MSEYKREIIKASARALMLIVLLGGLSYLLFPQSMVPVEAVVLEINYGIGEKMTYELDVIMKGMGRTYSHTMKYQMEILDKENGTSTVRTTFLSDLPNQTFSIVVKINATGYIVEYLNSSSGFDRILLNAQSFYLMPGNGFYFPRQETEVGDSWQIPIDMQTEEYNLTGTGNFRVAETRRITVPAGTYDVFKLEITDVEFALVSPPPPGLNVTEPVELVITIEGYEYFEKGTCVLVEAKFEQTLTVSTTEQTVVYTDMLDIRLTEHTR